WPSATASACLPPTLVSSTIKAAGLFAAGQATAAEVISVKVATLTEGVLEAMFMTKFKATLAVIVLLGMVAFGRGFIHQALVARETKGPLKAESIPANERIASHVVSAGKDESRADQAREFRERALEVADRVPD